MDRDLWHDWCVTECKESLKGEDAATISEEAP